MKNFKASLFIAFTLAAVSHAEIPSVDTGSLQKGAATDTDKALVTKNPNLEQDVKKLGNAKDEKAAAAKLKADETKQKAEKLKHKKIKP